MWSNRSRRRAIGVLGSIGCATFPLWIVTVPLTSKFVTILFQSRTLSIYIMKGALCLESDDAAEPMSTEFSVRRGFAMQRQVIEPERWDWGIRLPYAGIAHGRHSQFTLVVIPLWLPFVLTALPVFALWYRTRPPLPGQCPKCRYDLTNNLSGRCPECGIPITISPTHPEPSPAPSPSKPE